MERVEVRITVPAWLMDEVADILRLDVGRLTDLELDLVIEEAVQRMLEAVVAGDFRCPERIRLADALRAVRRVGWKKRMAAAATTATAR